MKNTHTHIKNFSSKTMDTNETKPGLKEDGL
jgi:hypothetical protein